jgi:uncharacterized protein (TIGR03118 family)
MHRNPGRSCNIRAKVVTSLVAASAFFAAATGAQASAYFQTDLTTDDNSVLTGLGYPAAPNVDPNLKNAWGISFGAATPFWISDNKTGVSTLYTAAGVPAPQPTPLVVTIATPPGQTPGTATPTGQVFNGNTSAFIVSNGTTSGSANFIFTTEDGTISGRSGAVDSTHSFIPPTVDNSAKGAVYKGLAIATVVGSPFLYAANFSSGFIERYDSTWMPAGTLTDPSPPPVPPGTPVGQSWAPFNVQVLGGQLYVAFALQAAGKTDDEPGAGHGFVDVFTLDGAFVKRLIDVGATDPLDSPWGLAIAPAGFGDFANDLLVGNFGNGEINAFNPTTGAFLGALLDSNSNPISIDGLWALTIGNSGAGVNPNAVYFSAGIDDEAHGLFGDLTVAAAAVPEPSSLALLVTGLTGLMWFRRRRPERH